RGGRGRCAGGRRRLRPLLVPVVPRCRRRAARRRARGPAPGRRSRRRRGRPPAPCRRKRDMSETPVNERPIGVFDSGLGGLTVLRALIDLLPNERTVYFGDTGHFPYGAKPLEDVLKYSLEITDLLLERDVKAIVIACNNAAAAALWTLDQRLDIPVMGVIEPGLRAGTKATRSGRLGVIATAGTVASGAYQQLSER